MQIDGYVQALREDLARLAALGDEHTAHAAEMLAVALESSIGRRLTEALGEAALELSSQLESGRIEVRLAGGDPEMVLIPDEEPVVEGAFEGLTARITLRLPESLKAQVERAAAAERASVNAWLVRAVRDALAPPARAGRPGPSRFTGLARA